MIRPPPSLINTLCLGPGDLDQHAATVARIRASRISPDLALDVEPCGPIHAAKILSDVGLQVATLTHRAFGFATPEITAAQRERLMRTLDVAHTLGAGSICMTSGKRGEHGWTAAAERFAEAVAPCVEKAKAAGVALALEPTSHLYADVSIAHRLCDLVTLAQTSGVGIGIDLFACWTDADIEAAIKAAGPLSALVQVSDYVLGDRGLPCRAVPGDGAVPVGHLIRQILATGYGGPFDIEVIGPRLAAEGVEAGLGRALAYVQNALADVSAYTSRSCAWTSDPTSTRASWAWLPTR